MRELLTTSSSREFVCPSSTRIDVGGERQTDRQKQRQRQGQRETERGLRTLIEWSTRVRSAHVVIPGRIERKPRPTKLPGKGVCGRQRFLLGRRKCLAHSILRKEYHSCSSDWTQKIIADPPRRHPTLMQVVSLWSGVLLVNASSLGGGNVLPIPFFGTSIIPAVLIGPKKS